MVFRDLVLVMPPAVSPEFGQTSVFKSVIKGLQINESATGNIDEVGAGFQAVKGLSIHDIGGFMR